MHLKSLPRVQDTAKCAGQPGDDSQPRCSNSVMQGKLADAAELCNNSLFAYESSACTLHCLLSRVQRLDAQQSPNLDATAAATAAAAALQAVSFGQPAGWCFCQKADQVVRWHLQAQLCSPPVTVGDLPVATQFDDWMQSMSGLDQHIMVAAACC